MFTKFLIYQCINDQKMSKLSSDFVDYWLKIGCSEIRQPEFMKNMELKNWHMDLWSKDEDKI